MRIKKSAAILLAIGLLILLYLGLADISLKNDKLIHFTTFLIMTIIFRNCIEDRNISKLRIITFTICTLVAGVGSEFFQSFFASYRSFDVMDIAVNVSGSLTGNLFNEIYIWYMNRRRSLMRLKLIKSIGNEADLFAHGTSTTAAKETISLTESSSDPLEQNIKDEQHAEIVAVPVYLEEQERQKNKSKKSESYGRELRSADRELDLEKGIELKNVLPVPLNEQSI